MNKTLSFCIVFLILIILGGCSPEQNKSGDLKSVSVSGDGVSLADIISLEEKAQLAESARDLDKLIEIYAELVEKIDHLEVNKTETYKLRGLSLEEYKKLKKERYQKMLDGYSALPEKIDQQIEETKQKINSPDDPLKKPSSTSSVDLVNAYYYNNLANLYISKKDYPMVRQSLLEAENILRDMNGQFFQIYHPETTLSDGNVAPASSSSFDDRDIKRRVFNTYILLWELEGIKEQEVAKIKSKFESNPNDFYNFMFLEQYYKNKGRGNNSIMLEYYLYVDSLNENYPQDYQYYLHNTIQHTYSLLEDYEGRATFLEKMSKDDPTVAIQLAMTYAQQGDFNKAVNYMETNYPGYSNETSWYKAHFYYSLGLKSSNGYGPFNNTYFEISNTYYEDCKRYGVAPASQYDYYIAQNYYYMGDKTKAREILDEVIANSNSAQEIANAEKFIEDYQL